MAYLALARKYRPQRFADMIGQEHVTRTLENAIRSDRVHHAYLFCGVRGLGKTTAARILAKALVCEKGPTPEPCNACVQCIGVNEGRSVDVIEIDGASNNSVEDVRSLRDQVNYLPQSARRKIYIIDEVHMLTQAAFNALLKTLEEPPPHVTFMFATTDPHKVLATILSRVSRLDYRRVRAATLAPYLAQILTQEGFAVEEEGLHVIARCGEGSVRDSLTLLDKVIAFAQDPKAITTVEVLQVLGHAGRFAVGQLIDAILARDAQLVLARFEEMTSTGSDLMRLAIAIMQHLRDLTVVKLTGGSRAALLDMSDDLYTHLCEQAKQVEASVISQHFDRFARVVDNLDHSRVPRLVIEMGLLELCNSEPLIPLGDLVSRLDALAMGTSGGGGGGGGSGGHGGGGGGHGRGPGRGRRADAGEPPAMRARPPSSPPHAGPAAHAPSPGPRPVAAQAEGTAPPPQQASPPQPASAKAQGDQADYLEQLAREAGLLPPSRPAESETGGRSPHRPPASPKPAVPEPRPAPVPEPAWPDAEPEPAARDFSLRGDTLPPVEAPAPAQGCPSSRSTPRDAIAWQQLDTWDAWETFLARIREEDHLLCGVLSRCGLVRLHEGVVQLASPSTGFAQTQLRENPELRTSFEHFTSVYFGQAMRLELLDVTPSLPHTPSLELVDRERGRRHREQIEHEAQAHPKLRSLLSTFSGELRHIEAIVGPALPPIGERGLPE